MRKIDAYNHIFPKPYWDKMIHHVGDPTDIGKRVRSIPVLLDLDERFRIMDMFDDYEQILSLTPPPMESQFPPDIAREMATIANDGMKELCDRHPDRFAGFVAALPMNAPEAAVHEARRAVKDLGALAVQIFTNIAGRALDRPEFFQVFEASHALDVPIYLHPARGIDRPDYVDEDRSLYEIFWALGWPYDTSVAQARLVFSGMMDKLPGLKIITHHMGGMTPFVAGRIGPGLQILGTRTPGPEGDRYAQLLKSLRKPHAEYFKDFYADTAVFGAREAILSGLAYYPRDKVLFASDTPFEPDGDPKYLRETINIIDSLDIDDEWRADIYWRNVARIMNVPERG